MMLVLCALFFRPLGFDYRSKVDDSRWRNLWDWGIFIGSFVPALVFGVEFGNLLLGVSFHFDDYLRFTIPVICCNCSIRLVFWRALSA